MMYTNLTDICNGKTQLEQYSIETIRIRTIRVANLATLIVEFTILYHYATLNSVTSNILENYNFYAPYFFSNSAMLGFSSKRSSK